MATTNPLNPVHPGKLLKKMLDDRHITPEKTAWAIKEPATIVREIIEEKREVSPEIALKLAYVFDGKTEDWYGKPRDEALEEAKERVMARRGLLQPLWKSSLLEKANANSQTNPSRSDPEAGD